MSYSFSARGKTKQDAMQDATTKLDAVIDQQPVHSRDREAALNNVRTHIDLVGDPAANEEVAISMHGSISVAASDSNAFGRITNASSGCSVWLQQSTPTLT